jgi:hypothetical protein
LVNCYNRKNDFIKDLYLLRWWNVRSLQNDWIPCLLSFFLILPLNMICFKQVSYIRWLLLAPQKEIFFDNKVQFKSFKWWKMLRNYMTLVPKPFLNLKKLKNIKNLKKVWGLRRGVAEFLFLRLCTTVNK